MHTTRMVWKRLSVVVCGWIDTNLELSQAQVLSVCLLSPSGNSAQVERKELGCGFADLPDAASAQVHGHGWECSAFSPVNGQERTECRSVLLRNLNIWQLPFFWNCLLLSYQNLNYLLVTSNFIVSSDTLLEGNVSWPQYVMSCCVLSG